MKEEKIEYHTEYRKGTAWNEREGALYKFMECKRCGQMSRCGEDTQATTCSDCVAELVGPVETSTYIKSDKPRGWTLMKEFVDKDGNVYHKGIEVPELKGSINKPSAELLFAISNICLELYLLSALIKLKQSVISFSVL